jgi:hypothetical protein
LSNGSRITGGNTGVEGTQLSKNYLLVRHGFYMPFAKPLFGKSFC